MAWDATRPIPWQRLLRDWLIYVGIMAVVFAIALRDDLSAGPFLGLLASGPIFLVIGGVLGGILAAALGATVTSDDLAAVAKTAPDGLVLTAPLKLRSQTMLLWWPALAAGVVAASLWLRPPQQPQLPP